MVNCVILSRASSRRQEEKRKKGWMDRHKNENKMSFTIESALLVCHLYQPCVILKAWLADKDTRVEAVGPACIGRGSKTFISVLVIERSVCGGGKEVVDIPEDERVCVEEDNLGVLCLVKDVDLCEGDTQFGSTEESKVFGGMGIDLSDFDDRVKDDGKSVANGP